MAALKAISDRGGALDLDNLQLLEKKYSKKCIASEDVKMTCKMVTGIW